jgi:ubiquinone/menaquinone biosynthesis C-methylase UbiE
MKDNFSKQADIYAKYRPQYPQQLFDFILQQTDKKQNAWDCATGNGQSAKVLAKYFEKVFATDISQKQIDNAVQANNIYYSVQPAEKTNFADNTFDLITVSQALHWFEFNSFYKEVRRIAKAGSLFAGWSYSLLHISTEIDKLIRSFYTEIIGPYWDAERKYVDQEYKTIPFPFNEIAAPHFRMEYYWTIKELEGYFNTWSALQKFIAANDYNPVPDVINQIKPHWANEKMKISFPLNIRMGSIEK